MQEMQVRSLGQEDPLEKGMATHSSALACEIPWMEEPGGLHFMGSQRVGHDLGTKQQQQQHEEIKELAWSSTELLPLWVRRSKPNIRLCSYH